MTRQLRFAHRMNINGRTYDVNEDAPVADDLADRLVYAGYAVYTDTGQDADPTGHFITDAEFASLRDQVNQIPAGVAVRVMPYGTTAAEVEALGLSDAVIIVPDYPPTTNMLPNPSFETDLTGWAMGVPLGGTVARSNSDPADAQDGAYAVIFTATGTATFRYISDSFTASPGEVFSAGAWFRRKAGTSTVLLCRVEIQFLDAAGGTLSTQFNSTPTVYAGATRQQVLAENKVAPANTASVKVRPYVSGHVAGDAVAIDAVQLERGVTVLPAYNPVTH